MKKVVIVLLILILSGCRGSSPKDPQADILSMFHDAGLKKYSEQFKKMIKQSIRLNTVREPEEKLQLGETKIGGQPDLPANVEWPYWKEYPMSFVAQINLEEMPHLQSENDNWPTKGIIYFFYTTDPDAMYLDSDFDNNPKTSKAIYYTGETNKLTRTQPPLDLSEELQFFSTRVTSRLEWNVPEVESFEVNEVLGIKWGDKDNDKYWDHFKVNFSEKYIEGYNSEFFTGMNRLYGYHDAVQGEYKGEGWRLLLQIDSEDSTNMEWDDTGRLYFWIKDADLKNLKFDEVTTIREGG